MRAAVWLSPSTPAAAPARPGGEPLPLSQCGCQLHRRAGRLFQHHGFQRLEVPAAHMAGKPGDRGVGDLQPLGQLPDGGEQEGVCVGVCVGVDIIQDLLLRPGQFPGRGGKAQVHSKASFFQNCLQRAVEPPIGGQQGAALTHRESGLPSGAVTRPPASSTSRRPAA